LTAPVTRLLHMRKNWWKIVCVFLLFYTVIGGFLFSVPRLSIINETIRALYFHVPMWFAMVVMFVTSTIYAIRYLRRPTLQNDILSVAFAHVGTIFGVLGIITGSIWANYAWGSPWHGDPKQTGAAITLLVYLAYFVLRGSLANQDQRARLSAVFNIFAFAAMVPLIFVIPRMLDSMHPGSGGNPGFNMYDLDSRMRVVFYPACAGWILLSLWFATLRVRIRFLDEHLAESEN
jgi:heme exporter protein C